MKSYPLLVRGLISAALMLLLAAGLLVLRSKVIYVGHASLTAILLYVAFNSGFIGVMLHYGPLLVESPGKE